MNTKTATTPQGNADTEAHQTWATVCTLEQLPLDGGLCALLNETQVALFRVSGVEEVYALANLDPFSNANVISRGVVGDIGGTLVVASPVYKQHFSLLDGVCLEDDSVFLKTYATRVVGDSVQLTIP
jgi:nitrite reductase (NADH) small subunit